VPDTGIIESFFLIFAGAAVVASAALYTRQPLLVAYIVVGCVLGPHGFGMVGDAELLSEIAEIGIIFLLFLVGLDLPPGKLRNMAGEGALTALVTAAGFFVLGYALMVTFDFSPTEAIVTGLAATFSSTILGIKLLPTTVLHHRPVGEIVISLLLIQDLIAIVALLLLAGGSGSWPDALASLGGVLVALPVLTIMAILSVRFLLLPLIARFDAFHEFIFLLALGWCLGLASIAAMFELSFAIGAFVAGVSLATSPISQYIAESLRPLRDFFLVLFFFTVGAQLDVVLLMNVLLPTVLLAAAMIALKPPAFALALKAQNEPRDICWEVGYRLGQMSEFSLLLSYVAAGSGLLSPEAGHVIQGATVMTLIVSTYVVIFRYPSPIALSSRLRRD
jgi:Kef-type K+ transport system membrane component KefB